MNRSQPLWMPRGSVRSIIALAFTFATIAGVMLTLGQANVPSSLAALFPVTAVIVHAYFDRRAAETAAPAPTGIAITSSKESVP